MSAIHGKKSKTGIKKKKKGRKKGGRKEKKEINRKMLKAWLDAGGVTVEKIFVRQSRQ